MATKAKKAARGKVTITRTPKGGETTTEEELLDEVVGARIAMIRVGVGMTVSRNYNGVRVDVALELPVDYRSDNDIKNGFTKVKAMTEGELASLKEEAEELLQGILDC